jgi:glycosyltransferase involved in cell wall biosynthesis
VIPTYNRADFLPKAIQSVLNQTYRDWEMIIVDDGSIDKTEEIVKDYKEARIRYIVHKSNLGSSAARNTGIKNSRGEYIAFLDSDDEWFPEKISCQMNIFQKEDWKCGVVCTGPSGRGKSTISTLLDQAGAEVLTDERAVIRSCDDGLRVYGTPWPSSGSFVLNRSVPLKKIYFIEHGLENEIVPISRGDAFKRMLDVVLVPWMNSYFFDPLINVLEKSVSDTPAAILRFKPDRDVVEFIKEDLRSARMREF